LLNICEGIPDSKFLSLPWEVLEPAEGPAFTVRRVPYGITKTEATSNPVETRLPACAVNLLFIVARPNKERDIGHRILCEPVVKLIENLKGSLGVSVHCHIVRPGSWHATVQYLEEVTKKHGRGCYPIVHLDVHGFIDGSQ
jgi:hypothetical protein